MVLFVRHKRILFFHFLHITGADPVFSVKPLDLSVKNTDLRGCAAGRIGAAGSIPGVCGIRISCCIMPRRHICCYFIRSIFRAGLQSDHLSSKTIVCCKSVFSDPLPQAVFSGGIIRIENKILISGSFQQFLLHFLRRLFRQTFALCIKAAGISGIFHAFPVAPERIYIQCTFSRMYVAGIIPCKYPVLQGTLFMGNAAGGAVHAPGFEHTVPLIHSLRRIRHRCCGVRNLCCRVRRICFHRIRSLCYSVSGSGRGHCHQPDRCSLLA